MEYDHARVDGSKYVFPAIIELTKGHFSGFISVGGNPDHCGGETYVAVVKAEKTRGLFGGYSIQERTHRPSQFVEVGRARTFSSARKKVIKRTQDLTEIVSKDLNVPIVGFDEARKIRDEADQIYCERLKASLG